MRLRLVGLRFTDLVHGSYQMNLFEDNTQLINLYQAMDAIKMRYGSDAVGRAVGFNFST
ncbi:DNA polymerase IV [compost metagenome]